MGLWVLIGLRLGILSTERVAFHGLGRGQNALAVTAVAYGGAALFLWAACLFLGQFRWQGEAFWPGAIYAVSFFLYTASLSEGPVSLVSAFANATAVILFLVAPVFDGLALAGIVLFGVGAAMLVPWGEGVSRAVWWMLLSDAALALGRILDSGVHGVASLPYAASLFSSVVLWLLVPVTAYGRWGDVRDLIRSRPGWGTLAAGANGFSYLTVFELLRLMPATLVEAVSAWAGVLAAAVGAVWFREGGGIKKLSASALMTFGTVILLFSQRSA
ncbi:hypothetical protein [Sulfobacillus harzensis]|uniref:EamA domain-containing protein n=1 Tax=Sulfobacillus harzensis TaxID=2729629 RepID=A0A7Y0Q445_9FIRM|nr:hypothetical protein [Sulfobacillus harzensis]NMP22849.1 hypothetical protein [Sulfobacillus harzensis]